MKLSIIIPVYNVEKYILMCLESVVNQKNVNLDDYEVIVVNDGSPDRSIDIINTFDWKGCQHQIINQDNKGLSGARNTGLKYAIGDYVWFIDSDDYITSNSVSSILRCANEYDIINIGYQEETEGVKGDTHLPLNLKTGKECLSNGFSQPAQFHVFKRSFLDDNQLRFYEGIYHEDAEFTPRCLYFAEKVANIQSVLYYYQIRGGSIMTVIKPKRAFDNLTVASSLIDFSIKQGCSLKDTPLLYTICMSLNNAMYIISQADRAEQVRWNEEFNQNPQFVKALKCSSVLKYKLEGYLFGLIKYHRVKLYRLLTKLK